MTFGTAGSGAAQGGSGLSVSDEDIRPTDTGSEKPDSSPKTGKQQDQSQPKSGDTQSKEGQQSQPDPAKDKGPGPWDAKLQQLGLDDPRFSEFFRNEVQPYITQLEQGGQGGDPQIQEHAESWQELLSAFEADPEGAYRELGELLGVTGGEMGDPNADLGGEGFDDDDLSLPGDEDEQDDPRLAYVDEIMERERTQKEDAEYDSFLKQMAERMPGFNDELFTTFVVANAGNLDLAMSQYEKYHKAPEPPSDAPPSPTGGTAPAAAPRFGSIGDAVSSWMSEDKASNPGTRR